jgi:predicted dehydrogenase
MYFSSMSTRIKFGLVGAGRIARNRIAPALHAAAHATFAAAASRDLARAESMRAARAYDSYDALLRDPDLDAVYIATHNGLHKDLSIAAMRAGKHVICEKPLAMNARDCAEMLRESEATGRLLAEAFMYRQHPQIAKVQELVRSGEIGEIVAVEASFRFPLTNVSDVRMNPDWGGGSLLDVGCYCVSASRLFLGDSPRAVSAVASFHPERRVDMSTQGVLDYGDGRHAVISCGFDGGVHQKLVLIGAAGVAELSQPFTSWAGRPIVTVRRGDDERIIPFEPVNTFQLEIDDLACAILQGGRPRVTAADALLNMELLDRLSAASRR